MNFVRWMCFLAPTAEWSSVKVTNSIYLAWESHVDLFGGVWTQIAVGRGRTSRKNWENLFIFLRKNLSVGFVFWHTEASGVVKKGGNLISLVYESHVDLFGGVWTQIAVGRGRTSRKNWGDFFFFLWKNLSVGFVFWHTEASGVVKKGGSLISLVYESHVDLFGGTWAPWGGVRWRTSKWGEGGLVLFLW